MTRVAHNEGQRIIVQSPGVRGFKTVDSKVVAALDSKSYSIKLFPTNWDSLTPSDQLDKMVDMLQAGLLTQEDARLYLGGGDNPDIDSTIALQNAPIMSVLAALDKILDGEEGSMPDPFMPLDDGNGGPGKGIQLAKWTYLKARDDGAPEEILDQLSLWIVTAVAMIQQFGSGAPPQQGLTATNNLSANIPIGTPQAKGAPPNVSPLLPAQGVTPPPPPGA